MGSWVFTVAAKAWERVGTGGGPRWLPDGRRLVTAYRGRIMLIDTVTKSAREIYVEADRGIGGPALAPDGRRLYFTSFVTESDMWLMRFDRSEAR